MYDERVCPRCGHRRGTSSGLSRTDDRTSICYQCIQSEALEHWMNGYVRPKDTWANPHGNYRSGL